MTFKVGDKVRIGKTYLGKYYDGLNFYNDLSNQIFTIARVDRQGFCRLDSTRVWADPYHLILVESKLKQFKVGDKVVIDQTEYLNYEQYYNIRRIFSFTEYTVTAVDPHGFIMLGNRGSYYPNTFNLVKHTQPKPNAFKSGDLVVYGSHGCKTILNPGQVSVVDQCKDGFVYLKGYNGAFDQDLFEKVILPVQEVSKDNSVQLLRAVRAYIDNLIESQGKQK